MLKIKKNAMKYKDSSGAMQDVGTLLVRIEGSGGSSDDVRYVTFMSEDGQTQLYVKPVAIGDDCVDVVAKGLIDVPEKESTAQYNYNYSGWATSVGGSASADALKNVTEDRNVYAAFTPELRYYTISYYDTDGTLLKSESLAYGSTPSYIPQKDDHTFDGWEPELATVTGDAEYTATWTEVVILDSGTFGDNLTWVLYDNYELIISGTGDMPTWTKNNEAPWYSHRFNIKSIVIEEGVTSIGYAAFYVCNAATSVSLPDSLTKIEKYVFYKCSKIASLTIPANVTYIGNNVFQSCDALTSVNFEVRDGWAYYDSDTDTTPLTISSSDLIPSTAANRLKSGTYWLNKILKRS